jgi:hypothetical protein
MSEPLLARREAAMLLAVERANGGELAGIEQVLVAFETLFARQMQPQAFAEACALLCEAELIEYVDESLGLTSDGRRLLRHTGLPGHSDRPHRVAEQLASLELPDLDEAGSVPSPEVAAFETAIVALESDGETGDQPMLGGDLVQQPPDNLTPYGWANQSQGPRLFSHLRHRHSTPPDAPFVQPAGDEPEPEPEDARDGS